MKAFKHITNNVCEKTSLFMATNFPKYRNFLKFLSIFFNKCSKYSYKCYYAVIFLPQKITVKLSFIYTYNISIQKEEKKWVLSGSQDQNFIFPKSVKARSCFSWLLLLYVSLTISKNITQKIEIHFQHVS